MQIKTYITKTKKLMDQIYNLGENIVNNGKFSKSLYEN